ncbi:putative membrane protein [Mucilaginibacter gracilis]|uniref:Putative membrane protein n=1 Tax=Mucilaginibacter gracilis TaxID=423350 RepID=A0A495J3J0_9SPHI|nr:bestrophin family ion channel [Mucilaginibacter gracilis]RKR83546.1 putative membrane protein [Mucilaginibacter gracilis]
MLLKKRIPVSYILQKIWLEVLYVLVVGLLVNYLTAKYKNLIPAMPIAIPAFIGTAISVILSFKINQSYDRWWEARKVWGSIVNESRSFVLQLQSFVAKEKEKEIKQIAYRQIAWCYSLGQTLRGLDALKNLSNYISATDLDKIKKHNNKPLALLQLNALQITDLKDSGSLELFSHIQINSTLVNFSNAMGMAERIKSTVFPQTYRLFLHFFIYIFVVTLAIALIDIDSFFEIPLLLVISSAFFLLEKSATHLQDPFSNRPTDTAMTTIATNIEINIKQLLGETEVPQPLQPQSFYSL